MYKYLFGPVLSRRLGLSLGIDCLPEKICSFNCIYCECGPTKFLTIERKEYLPLKEILKEIKNYMTEVKEGKKPSPDFITFSGQGEPTLYSKLGEIVKFLKENYPENKIALLTNSSLLVDEKVIEEIKEIDILIPSLDTANKKTFKKLNRPNPNIDLDEIIKGLSRLKEKVKGKIWLEIFIVPGLNSSKEELYLLKEAIDKIRPDKVQINSIDRPGIYPWIRTPTEEEINLIKEIIPEAQFISSPISSVKYFYKGKKDKEVYIKVIKELVKRRPQTIEELKLILNIEQNFLTEILKEMLDEKIIKIVEKERGSFVTLA